MIHINDSERDVLKVIKKWQRFYTNSPNVSELSEELQRSVDSVRYTLGELEKKGFLDMVYPPVGHRMVIVVLWWE
jgi:Mn-dependent DtxR family transcriptional regulator